MATAGAHTNGQSEVAILARILGNDRGRLPAEMARYLLTLGFSDEDKARMHDLAARNREYTLTSAEQEELQAYARIGTLLSILKSKARQTLRSKPAKRTTS